MADKNRKEIQVQVLIDAAQAAKTLGELKTALGNIKGAINELGEEGAADVEKLNGALKETTTKLQPLQDAADKAAARVEKLSI